MTRLRVLAAMSGGVDSAVAAARAADAGHDVTGVHLALSMNPRSYRTGARGCCTLEDARDARRAADVIGIPFYVWDMAQRFHDDVVRDFVEEYAHGHTPNPCLRCNEKIKFAAVLDRAVALGFDRVCTGHHARLKALAGPGRAPSLARSADQAKDQSYVLAVLTSDQLSRAMFPLGGSTKGEVRKEAAARGLAVADKPDGRPRYVLDIEPVSGTVTVGPAESLDVTEIRAQRPVWTGCPPPAAPLRCLVQLRAHGAACPATAWADGAGLRIRLHEPARGVARGQAAVLYDADTVLGSATITGSGGGGG